MSRQLLVPVDGSPLSNRALEHAFDAYDDSSVVALHVIDPADPGYSSPIDVDVMTEPPHGSEAWYERAEKEEERIFDEARDLAADHDADLSTESAIGDPAREIVDYTEDHDVDAIVMGSHGRSGPTRLLLGSTAELVVSRAPVTVTVVRDEVA
ncbi:universal stress protein [Halosolutus amylolyticus]|uniref:Universal stress protein n=1 Tax=Halosolutus amylolyticus TaxID=2932267 RepID=A0ABD5PLZ1_9EURY|nr:universal stress protein [Halosolutus amylolyticus]